jgi:hypothetical protein
VRQKTTELFVAAEHTDILSPSTRASSISRSTPGLGSTLLKLQSWMHVRNKRGAAHSPRAYNVLVLFSFPILNCVNHSCLILLTHWWLGRDGGSWPSILVEVPARYNSLSSYNTCLLVIAFNCITRLKVQQLTW